MRVLGLDLETSGIDPFKDQIIEIGAILWDCERQKPLTMMSRLIKQDNLELDSKITEITGIEKQDLDDFGIPLSLALEELQALATNADYIVAHNGKKFDKLFLETAWKSHAESLIDLPWIDTTQDIPFGEEIQSKKLNYLAADHNFINPFAHRAVFDVMTMMMVFSKYPLDKILDLASSETKRIIAKVSFDEKELAKKEGFRWDPSAKVWYKDIKEIQIKDLSFPFTIDYV
tara:strand:+ start:20343 stop:21035 length:693 start_codon:yes stop_codon:yes gene_type:complete